MHNAHLIGTGSAVPQRILNNQDLEKIVDTSNEWILRRTGIRERRISNKHRNESTTDLGARAAAAAMQMANVTAEQLDLIIVATVTGDRQFPAAGCLIQKEIGALNAVAYDISAGCSGFIFALELANNAIRTGSVSKALVIGAERLSSLVDWKDRSTCVLLGDGAGAALLESRPEAGGILTTCIKSDGNYWDLLYSDEGTIFHPQGLEDTAAIPFHLKMEGNRLFKQAVGCMASITDTALAQVNLTRDDIDLIIPHQANLRILQAVADKLQLPMDVVFTNLQKYGNTSSASIPLAMDEACRQGRLHKGDNILLISFGAGLTWGASIIRWGI
jgi:3-oxoacyl-[acyl-carrier-protein] synthase-3